MNIEKNKKIYFLAIIFLILSAVIYMYKTQKTTSTIVLINIEDKITDSNHTLKLIRNIKKTPNVKAVVIRIDSPGGAVVPSQEIYEELIKLKKTGIKIVVSMGSVTASGGYYIACAADKIVANSGTLTGSIGAYIQFANIEETINKLGLKFYTIKSGKHKDIGSWNREMTEEEKILLQEMVSDIYNQFFEVIIENRKITKEELEKIADGRIFTGRQAKTLKLVDSLGTIEDALTIAADLAKIKGEPNIITEKTYTWNFLNSFNSLFNSLFKGNISLPKNKFELYY